MKKSFYLLSIGPFPRLSLLENGQEIEKYSYPVAGLPALTQIVDLFQNCTSCKQGEGWRIFEVHTCYRLAVTICPNAVFKNPDRSISKSKTITQDKKVLNWLKLRKLPGI